MAKKDTKNSSKSRNKSNKEKKLLKLKKAIIKLKIFEKKLKAKEKEIDKKLKKLKSKKRKEKNAAKAKENLIKSSNNKVGLKKEKRIQKKEKQKANHTPASLDKKALSQNEPIVDKTNDTNKKPSSTELTVREAITYFRDFTEIKEIDNFIKNENRVSILRAASSRKKAIQNIFDKSSSL